jgi:hypothetical protein
MSSAPSSKTRPYTSMHCYPSILVRRSNSVKPWLEPRNKSFQLRVGVSIFAGVGKFRVYSILKDTLNSGALWYTIGI